MRWNRDINGRSRWYDITMAVFVWAAMLLIVLNAPGFKD
jgi:hypothetical protein